MMARLRGRTSAGRKPIVRKFSLGVLIEADAGADGSAWRSLYLETIILWLLDHPEGARNDKTTADPIVNHPKADTISVADLTDVKHVVGRLWRRDTVFLS
jgi:hypothetical protein